MLPTNAAKAAYRKAAFKAVLEAYAQIKNTVGTVPGTDYAQMASGATGAKNSFNDAGFRLIDFLVDVIATAKSELTPGEFQEFLDFSGQQDYSVQSKAFIKLQNKVGALFLRYKLYPLTNYFTVIKRTRPE